MTASVPLRQSRGVESRKSRSKSQLLGSFGVPKGGTPQDDSVRAFLRNFLNLSSPFTEKLAQNSCAFAGQHARNDLNPVVDFRVVEDR